MIDYLFEATVGPQKKRAVVMIGRFQPPTRGHYKVIDRMKAFMRENPELKIDAPIIVIVAGEKTSEDKAINPLSAEDRAKFIQASGRANGVKILIAGSGFAAFEEVRKAGFEPIAVAAGSDRADKYIELLDKYFLDDRGEKITHVKVDGLERATAPEKNEKQGALGKALAALHTGSELDVSEVSGSLARRAVELGFEEEFAEIVGLESKPRLAKLMFNKIKAAIREAENGLA